MAKLNENRPRSTRTLAEGRVICNPPAGKLMAQVPPPYTGEIAVEIANYRLWFDREEFLTFADRATEIAKMIRAAASVDGEVTP